MFGGFGLTELLVVLAIVLLVFGPRALKTLGPDLGAAIRGFRAAVADDPRSGNLGPGQLPVERSAEDTVAKASAPRAEHV